MGSADYYRNGNANRPVKLHPDCSASQVKRGLKYCRSVLESAKSTGDLKMYTAQDTLTLARVFP